MGNAVSFRANIQATNRHSSIISCNGSAFSRGKCNSFIVLLRRTKH